MKMKEFFTILTNCITSVSIGCLSIVFMLNLSHTPFMIVPYSYQDIVLGLLMMCLIFSVIVYYVHRMVKNEEA